MNISPKKKRRYKRDVRNIWSKSPQILVWNLRIEGRDAMGKVNWKRKWVTDIWC